MKKLKWIILSCFCGITLSCGDFLEEYSLNLKYVESAEDLQKVLIREGYLSGAGSGVSAESMPMGGAGELCFPWIHLMDDDTEEFALGYVSADDNSARNMLGAFHHWAATPTRNVQNEDFKDGNWERLYKHIGVLNALIYTLEEIRENEKDQQLCNRVEGESRFLRASYYFLLANIYGLPYDKANGGSDFSVPLKITEYIEDRYFERATASAVYNQIVIDLKRAAVCLKNINPASALRVGPAAPYALLSRVYLYMEEYELAIAAAEEVLTFTYNVLDYNGHEPTDGALYLTSPELIFSNGYYQLRYIFANEKVDYLDPDKITVSSFKVSNNLLSAFEPEDLRLKHFFIYSTITGTPLPQKNTTWKQSNTFSEICEFNTLRLPEVLLNKAEAEAMLGKTTDAVKTLELLRVNRFPAAAYQPVQETGNNLIQFIRDERRRELCFEAHRWFDLRRYAVNSVYPLSADFKIRHTNYTYDPNLNMHFPDGYYELNSYRSEQGSWVIPVPKETIEFNQGSITNLMRPEHKVISVR